VTPDRARPPVPAARTPDRCERHAVARGGRASPARRRRAGPRWREAPRVVRGTRLASRPADPEPGAAHARLHCWA